MKIPARFLPIAATVLLAALVRTTPYILGALGLTNVHDVTAFLWNLSPIGALFLFGGAKFAERSWAYLAPLMAMLLSDLAIGLLMRDMSMGFNSSNPVTYGAYALMIWLGTRLRDRPSALAIAGAASAGEIAFFVVTNFAVWVGQTEYYPHSFEGLVSCYVAAIPFFRHSLLGMALYGTALFGGLALLERRVAPARSNAVIG